MRVLLLLLVAFVFFASPVAAVAQAKFSCQLSEDKRTLRIVVSNPYDQETHCQVNCHFDAPGGGTVSGTCGRTVPAKAENFMLCMQVRPNNAAYGNALASSNGECVKPLTNADRKKEDEDDEALVKKLQQDGLDALKRLQKQ